MDHGFESSGVTAVLILVRDISIILVILLFCYLVLVGQVNVEFLRRLNVHGPFFALLVLENLRFISEPGIY
jgi:hypothetical protein